MMYKKSFFFRQERQLKKINLDEIFYLEAAKNYTKMYTAKGTFIARITLVEAMKLLPIDKFLRVHRSYAVAVDHIDVVKRDEIHMAPIAVAVPVSRIYYGAFTKQFIILDSADIDTGKKRMVNARERRG
jgi:DNA-binding LytR/AlgR family response regulator